MAEPAARPAKTKEGKDGGGGGKKQKALAAELTALRADVDRLKTALSAPATPTPAAKAHEPLPRPERLEAGLTEPTDAAVFWACAYRRGPGDGPAETETGGVTGLAEILRPDNERLARLGNAFASAPKVALIRSLLMDGPRGAAPLGETAGLTTGSLYHHLRELVHAGVIRPSGRSQYALTELGRQAALLLFTLAGQTKP